MLRLAVATDAETLARIRDPLADRGVEAVHVPTAERTVNLTGSSSRTGDGDPTGDGDSTGPEEFADFDVGFVFPSRLAEGGVADALLDVPWVNDREAILRSRHKGEALARLRAAGVPTPETVVVSNPADEAALRDAFEAVGTPAVVKPNSTTRGTGVARVEDPDSFLGVTDYLELVHDYRATGDRSYLVQSYLDDARDYRVMCVEGGYVGAVERRLPAAAREAGRWKHNVHRGAEATGVDLSADLRALAERAARALDVPWLGVDLLVADDGDGRAVVNETNARPTVDSATKYEDGFHDRLADLVRRTAEQG